MTYKEKVAKAMKNGKSINITPKFINLTMEEPLVMGRYLVASSVQSSVSEGTYLQYLFDTDDGLIKFHLGAACDAEIGSIMKIGNIYAIEFLGQEKLSGSRSVNKYHIEEIPDEPEAKG